MKHFLFLLCIVISGLLSAQVSQGGYPFSFHNPQRVSQNVNEIIVQSPDVEQLIMEDIESHQNGGKYRVGTLLPVNISPSTSGTWDNLENGDKIWRLQITTEQAKSLSLYFDDFFLPTGATLFVYSSDKSEFIGSFTEFNNHESRLFATQTLATNSLIIELYLPSGSENNYALNISDLGFAYRGFYLQEDSERSCMVNINCPEGNNWQTQKRGVAKILMVIGSQQYLCSGSLINNTKNDCQPYFLSAYHCGEGATTNNLNQWVFYFNYEASTCGGGETGSQNQTVIGCQLLSWAPGTWPPQGSDFMLLRLNNNVPTTYNPFFNGWNRTTNGSPSGVSIHHPGGRNKKISTYTTTLQNYQNTHWAVYWSQTQTNHSITAGGSSGSPIFNNSGLIVGSLTGGSSTCSQPNEPDVYGRFSYHWESNGTANNRRLRPWLDPVGTNPTSLIGINHNQCGTVISSCDTVSNINNQDLYLYSWAENNGYVSGHNNYGIMEFAEKFTSLSLPILHGVWLLPGKAIAGSASSNITLKIMQAGTTPGTVLASKNVAINSLTEAQWNYIPLNTPLVTTGNFYVGYQIYNNSGDNFALAMADKDMVSNNTVYLKHNNQWTSLFDLTNSSLKSHLAILVNICAVAAGIPEQPIITSEADDIVSIYPNPAQDILHIQFVDSKTHASNIIIYDMLGKVITTLSFSEHSDTYSLSTENLQNGLYFISIQTGDIRHTKRFLIKK